MKIQLLTTFILTSIFCGSLAVAQEGPFPPREGQDRQPGLEDRARQAPRQGQERPDREARRQRFLEKFDGDGDGRLSEQERETMRSAMQERRQRRGEQSPRADRRRQGEQRSRTDRSTQEGQGRAQDGSHAERRARILKRFDRNGDGQLDEEERAALHQAMQQRRRELNPEASSSCDRRARGSADAPQTGRRPSRRSSPPDNQ